MAAYFAVWMVSGLLHGTLLMVFGNPLPAVVFALIFTGLVLAGSAVIFRKQRRRREQHIHLHASAP